MKQKETKKINATEKIYDQIASEFSNTRHFPWKEFKLYIKYFQKSQSILDLGCGNGRLYNFIKKEKKEKFNYTGIDISQNLLNIAKNTYKEAKFIKKDFSRSLELNKKFDLACSIASFHHLFNKETQKKHLKDINKHLKKDGILIISVWNLFQKKYIKEIIKTYFRAIIKLDKSEIRDCHIKWGQKNKIRHYYAFTKKEMQDLLEKSGFKIIKYHKTNNLIYICQKK